MKRALVGMGLFFTVACAAACSKKDEKATEPAVETGVPECDAYVSKYEACLSKMSPEARTSAAPGFAAQRTAFKSNATTPEAKAQLTSQCKAALEAIRPTCGP